MTDIGQYYHVLNRGNEKQDIFHETENYHFFLRQLGKYLKSYGPTLIAYCLMPNHFHILMHENGNDGIPRCMHALQTSFSKAVNEKYNRSGHLFQDSYKKVRIHDNSYLLHLTRYIHLNPVEGGLVSIPEDWIYSSYREYTGLRKGSLPQMDVVLSQFSGYSDYRKFVMDKMNDMDLGKFVLE